MSKKIEPVEMYVSCSTQVYQRSPPHKLIDASVSEFKQWCKDRRLRLIASQFSGDGVDQSYLLTMQTQSQRKRLEFKMRWGF
ncbi:hypothetical protein D8770_16895 [Methylobacterium sp. DB1607]|nr:hypothetical protein [Methylobacterium sp. DB1607]